MNPDERVELAGFLEAADEHRILLRLEDDVSLLQIRLCDVLDAAKRSPFILGVSDGVPVSIVLHAGATVDFVETVAAGALALSPADLALDSGPDGEARGGADRGR